MKQKKVELKKIELKVKSLEPKITPLGRNGCYSLNGKLAVVADY